MYNNDNGIRSVFKIIRRGIHKKFVDKHGKR